MSIRVSYGERAGEILRGERGPADFLSVPENLEDFPPSKLLAIYDERADDLYAGYAVIIHHIMAMRSEFGDERFVRPPEGVFRAFGDSFIQIYRDLIAEVEALPGMEGLYEAMDDIYRIRNFARLKGAFGKQQKPVEFVTVNQQLHRGFGTAMQFIFASLFYIYDHPDQLPATVDIDKLSAEPGMVEQIYRMSRRIATGVHLQDIHALRVLMGGEQPFTGSPIRRPKALPLDLATGKVALKPYIDILTKDREVWEGGLEPQHRPAHLRHMRCPAAAVLGGLDPIALVVKDAVHAADIVGARTLV